MDPATWIRQVFFIRISCRLFEFYPITVLFRCRRYNTYTYYKPLYRTQNVRPDTRHEWAAKSSSARKSPAPKRCQAGRCASPAFPLPVNLPWGDPFNPTRSCLAVPFRCRLVLPRTKSRLRHSPSCLPLRSLFVLVRRWRWSSYKLHHSTVRPWAVEMD